MNATDFVIRAAQIGAGLRSGPFPELDSPALWPDALELAIAHRVGPLVGEALAKADNVPSKVAAALAIESLRSSATRLLCESALLHLVTTLRGHGVEVIVLKGPTVAHTVYPRPDLRIYHDIDLLCRPGDYAVLHTALTAAGYTDAGTLDARGTHESLAEKPSAFESHSVRGFYDPSGDVKVEVHFDALQIGLVDRHEEELWRESRTLVLEGVTVRMLGPEHQFLHLAVHAHRHGYTRLSWLIELELVVQKLGASIDWRKLATLARAEGVGSMLRHAIATAHAVLGAPLPDLPAPTAEERLLGASYRALWPFEKTRALNQHEHKRLLHFLPDDADPRNVLYGLILVGRRREKLDAILRRRWPPARGTARVTPR